MVKQILDFILVESRLDFFFIHLAWIGPIVGILFGFIYNIFRRQFPEGIIKGFLIGLTCPFISLLWFVYNLITDHFGIDSVVGLFVNLSFFALTGLIIGLVFRFIVPSKKQVE